MKIYLLTFTVFMLFGFSSKAQNSSILVLNVKGQVDYLKDQSSTKERLLPGMKISGSGALELKEEARVNLLYNGKRIQLDKQGAYDIKTLIEKNDKALSMSFAGRFWDFVNDGLSHSDDTESLNKYEERLLAVTGGVQGFAMGESRAQTIMPATGYIGANIVTFNWHSIKTPAVFYQFKIYLVEQEELVFQAITRDTSLTLDFSQLVFHPNNSYEWQIETESQNKSEAGENEVEKSDFRTFEYMPNIDELIAEKTAKIEEYADADAFEKKWMEAIVMEQEGFIYDAYNRYNDLRLQSPENLLVKKLFASFLVRQGLTQQALEEIK